MEQRKVQLEDARKDHEVAEGKRSLSAAQLSEVRYASVRLEQARFNVIQAERNRRKALSELYSLIGRPDETEGYVEGRLDTGGSVPELKPLSDAVLARPEIGIRRAGGSRKRDIILQFLMESPFISVNVGIIGMAAGFLMSLAIAKVLGYHVSDSIPGLLVAFAASTLSGIVAGIYPAFKATQIHPVDIIRS